MRSFVYFYHHDDFIKWRQFPSHRSPVNSPHKGQWRGTLMFFLVGVWINSWANNVEAGDLSRHHAHYDVTVMITFGCFWYEATGLRNHGSCRCPGTKQGNVVFVNGDETLYCLVLTRSPRATKTWYALHDTWWRHQMKASDAELWRFLWFMPEQMFEQTIEMQVIWDAIALILMLFICK